MATRCVCCWVAGKACPLRAFVPAQVRREELRLSFWNALMKVINVACVFCVPPMTAFVIFINYEFNEARLVSSVAFTTLSLFNILRFPLVVLPKALRAVSEANASLQRLEAYLLEDVPAGDAAANRTKGAAAGVSIVSDPWTGVSAACWCMCGAWVGCFCPGCGLATEWRFRSAITNAGVTWYTGATQLCRPVQALSRPC